MTGPCRKGKKVKSAYLNKGNEQLQDDGLTEEGVTEEEVWDEKKNKMKKVCKIKFRTKHLTMFSTVEEDVGATMTLFNFMLAVFFLILFFKED